MDTLKLKMAAKKTNYVGEVTNQKRNGYGIYVYPNSFFRYEGEWNMGRKHGLGKLLMKDGSYYEGDFVCGEIEGNGLRYWAKTGDSYSGQFDQGELHGFGVLQRARGETYEGQFSYGRREGHGSLTDREGQTYLGSFHQDKRHGEGCMQYRNGDQYEGNWVLDQKQGQGVLRCVDGSLYDGQWRNDLFNGQGTVIHASGVVWEGLWTNGRPLGGASIMVIEGGGGGRGGGGGGGGTLEAVQGRAFSVEVRLQTADAGETASSESGRVLRISAGVRTPGPPPGAVAPALINTPFGFQVVGFPLMDREAFEDAASPVITSSRSPTTTTTVAAAVASVAKLPPLASPAPEPAPTVASDPAPAAASPPAASPPAALAAAAVAAGASCSSLPQGEWECGSRSHGSSTPGGGATATPGYLDGPRGPEDAGVFPPVCRRVREGRARFQHLMLAPPPSDSAVESEKGAVKPSPSKEPSRGPNASKNALRRPSQCSLLPGNSRKTGVQQSRAVKPGEYVIMVEDVTSPPFMGQTLPTAFALLRLRPAEAPQQGAKAPR